MRQGNERARMMICGYDFLVCLPASACVLFVTSLPNLHAPLTIPHHHTKTRRRTHIHAHTALSASLCLSLPASASLPLSVRQVSFLMTFNAPTRLYHVIHAIPKAPCLVHPVLPLHTRYYRLCQPRAGKSVKARMSRVRYYYFSAPAFSCYSALGSPFSSTHFLPPSLFLFSITVTYLPPTLPISASHDNPHHPPFSPLLSALHCS
ncbi:hypothetical protein F4861DRAFT_261747 [Xylaria intraflava]|nr:hypothetical protein F4861DRAFT_261747 [Xylaria intraflava]